MINNTPAKLLNPYGMKTPAPVAELGQKALEEPEVVQSWICLGSEGWAPQPGKRAGGWVPWELLGS